MNCLIESEFKHPEDFADNDVRLFQSAFPDAEDAPVLVAQFA